MCKSNKRRTISFHLVLLVILCSLTNASCTAHKQKTTGGSQATATRPQSAVPASQECPPCPPAPGSTAPPPKPNGALGELDSLFISSYKNRQESLKQQKSPVIVLTFGTLNLYVDGKKQDSKEVTEDMYHVLKSIAHVPFGIYLNLQPELGKSFSDVTKAKLKEYKTKIMLGRDDLPRWNLKSNQQKRMETIIQTSLDFISTALDSNNVSDTQLETFAKTLGPLMYESASEAGCLQIQDMHSAILEWRNTLGCSNWQNVMFLNRGMHQARYRNVGTQYFAWLIPNEPTTSWAYPGESMRNVFVESLAKNDDSRDLMATVLIDAQASKAFFGDSWRLSEDILSSGAASCIAILPTTERDCVAGESKVISVDK
jgi:hypothetical protein